jgi:hypothetical protein
MRVPRASRSDGFTLVELCGASVLAAVLLLTMHTTLQSSVRSRRDGLGNETRQTQAYEFLQRLQELPFGTGTEGAPTAEALTELFDDDDELGDLSLRQVQTPVGVPGHGFTTDLDGTRTRWRIVVSDDLDGDGRNDGPREGRPDLLRIEILADDRLMFRTLRAAEVANTRRD